MAAPTITVAPDAPVRGEDRETFASKANDFVSWQAQSVSEYNALGTFVSDKADQVEQDAAQVAEDRIQTGQDAVATAADANSAAQSASAAQDAAATVPSYSTATVELGGDFDAGQSVTFTRIGNIVTVTAPGVLTHTSASIAQSAANIIPSIYRPTSRVSAVYVAMGVTNGDGDLLSINISGGVFSLKYYERDNFSAQRTDSFVAPSISYVVT